MKKNEIQLGCIAEHLISGIQGVVTSKSEAMNGQIQYALGRKGVDKNEKPHKSSYYDEVLLKFVEDGDIPQQELIKTSIELGDNVKHYSGFKGVVQEVISYLSGCILFGVMPKAKSENEYPNMKWAASQYLEVDGKKKVAANKDKGGGPSSLAPSM